MFWRVGQIPQKLIDLVEPAVRHADMIEVINSLDVIFDLGAVPGTPQGAEIVVIDIAVAKRRFTEMRPASINLAVGDDLREERQSEAGFVRPFGLRLAERHADMGLKV